VCHGFRLTKRDDYFWVDSDHFWIDQYFWRQLGQYWKLARALKRTTIGKFSLPKSVKRSEVLLVFPNLNVCTFKCKNITVCLHLITYSLVVIQNNFMSREPKQINTPSLFFYGEHLFNFRLIWFECLLWLIICTNTQCIIQIFKKSLNVQSQQINLRVKFRNLCAEEILSRFHTVLPFGLFETIQTSFNNYSEQYSTFYLNAKLSSIYQKKSF